MPTSAPAGTPHARLITHVADRPGHDRRYAVSAAALRRGLGWSPRRAWQEGVAEAVRWYLENPAWLEAVQSSPAHQAWMRQRYGG